MTITFYLLLTILNWTGLRRNFDWKKMESKMNWFFGIYTTLIVLMFGLSIFLYFVSIIGFVITLTITLWFIGEWVTDKAILIYGTNKTILHEEFMGVNKDSVEEAKKNTIKDKHHK